MWRIILCDDDIEFLSELKEKLFELVEDRMKQNIQIYTNPIELLKEQYDKTDILFLDIDMPEMSGLEVAKRLVETGENPVLIFISNHEEVVFESIQYQPFRFLRKRYMNQELTEMLPDLYEFIQKRERKYIIDAGQQKKVCVISDIYYIESCGHYVIFHTRSEDIRIRGKLLDYMDIMQYVEFLNPQKSYLINCEYIKKYVGMQIELLNDIIIKVSRNQKEETEKRYMEYLRR